MPVRRTGAYRLKKALCISLIAALEVCRNVSTVLELSPSCSRMLIYAACGYKLSGSCYFVLTVLQIGNYVILIFRYLKSLYVILNSQDSD